MTEERDLFEIITIVIALDILYNDFDTTIASMLETGNKSINEIFTIIQSKEAKFKNKQAIKNIVDAVLTFCVFPPKKKATYDNLCYNCHQKGYFGQNYSFPDCRRKTDIFCQLKF